ncbi:MAG: hypothetical protein ABUL60_31050 [Myxococcales bacterium]
MKTTRCAPLTVTWPSEQLRGAALAGLLCFATAACSSNEDAPGPNGAAGATTTAGTAGEHSAAGSEAVGAAGATNGAAGAHAEGGASAAGSGGEAGGGVPTTLGGAAGAAGAGDVGGVGGAGGAGGEGSIVEPAHITSSTNVGVLTEEQFTALCDERDGTVEVMPHCGGFATAAGFSYDSGTQLLSEHTCAGANTCGGWNCITTK